MVKGRNSPYCVRDVVCLQELQTGRTGVLVLVGLQVTQTKKKRGEGSTVVHTFFVTNFRGADTTYYSLWTGAGVCVERGN